MPLGQRRYLEQLQGAQSDLRRLHRHRLEVRSRPGMVDQRLQIRADAAEFRRAYVERLAGGFGSGSRAHDRVDQILDAEQLVAVVSPPEDVDPASFADPIEQDLEDAQALRA